jgi:hypothetical protein
MELVPVDSDVPASALPASEPEGILLTDGRFFAYDQTMEVFRTMQTIIDKVGKDPSQLGRDESRPPEQLPNTDWAVCYLWAITYPSRKEQGAEDMRPVDFLPLLKRSQYKQVTREMVQFLKDMNPDPNADGGA